MVDVLGRSPVELGIGLSWWGGTSTFSAVRTTPPKPNPWQGAHRLTSCNWWATANARNTALCLVRHDFVAFLDDRAHPGPDWLACVRAAEAKREAAIAGLYVESKPRGRRSITATRSRRWGRSTAAGLAVRLYVRVAAFVGLRSTASRKAATASPGEDYIFGLMLQNAGHRIDFVPEMFVRQERAAGNESCKGSYACRDKGKSPHDKATPRSRGSGSGGTEYTPDLTQLRARIAAGEADPGPGPIQTCETGTTASHSARWSRRPSLL